MAGLQRISPASEPLQNFATALGQKLESPKNWTTEQLLPAIIEKVQQKYDI